MLRRLAVLCALAAVLSACVVVPQNRRRHLADPTMTEESALESASDRKMHTSREGAGGGDGAPAGGGCGCGN